MTYKQTSIALSISSKLEANKSLISCLTLSSKGIGGIYDEPPMVTGTPLILPPS